MSNYSVKINKQNSTLRINVKPGFPTAEGIKKVLEETNNQNKNQKN